MGTAPVFRVAGSNIEGGTPWPGKTGRNVKTTVAGLPAAAETTTAKPITPRNTATIRAGGQAIAPRKRCGRAPTILARPTIPATTAMTPRTAETIAAIRRPTATMPGEWTAATIGPFISPVHGSTGPEIFSRRATVVRTSPDVRLVAVAVLRIACSG